MEDAQASVTSTAEESAAVEAGEPSTSEPRPHGELPPGPLPCSPRAPPRKRKASARSPSKNREKTPGKSPGGEKKRARKAHRKAPPRYFVHETDNDMLLIISNEGEGGSDLRPSKKASKRRKKTTLKKKLLQGRKAKVVHRERRKPAANPGASEPEKETPRGSQDGEAAASRPTGPVGVCWGQKLPVEILVRIFRFVVASSGAVPFLCRMSRVCRLWQGAAANPILWQDVSMGFCWLEPGKKQQPQNKKRILTTVQWLATNRFSLTRIFALHHWKNQVPIIVKTVGESCPHLTSLKLNNCTGITTECLVTVARQCPKLESLNLQNSQVDSTAVVGFLEVAGPRMRELWLTYSTRLNSIFNMLSSGSCSELRLLEVTTEIKQGTDYLQFSIEALQAGCPKLQVLRLLNVIWSPKSSSRCLPGAPGFPELEELCLATSSYSFVGDDVCLRILRTSTKLRVLDLRGCYRITPIGLQKLPCTDLENLYLGLYCSNNNLILPREGCHLITWKWPHSLRELDLMGQAFCENDLELALAALARDSGNPLLRTLNLAGTKVTLKSIRAVIVTCPHLSYLNLTSCRYLPRGMKRAYSGQQDIQQCLKNLEDNSEEFT